MPKLTMLAALLLAAPAFGEITPTVELSTVLVEVTWVESDVEMRNLRRQYGRPPRGDAVYSTALTGFAVLGKRDGQHVCLLFARKPEKVDDKRTLVLGHEVLHCLLGAYH